MSVIHIPHMETLSFNPTTHSTPSLCIWFGHNQLNNNDTPVVDRRTCYRKIIEETIMGIGAGMENFICQKDALAAGWEYGILEGRSLALIHPIVTGGLFIYTLYAGYLGWQWRRVRTIQDEINELKKQVKPVAVSPERKPTELPAPSVEAKIQQLSEIMVDLC